MLSGPYHQGSYWGLAWFWQCEQGALSGLEQIMQTCHSLPERVENVSLGWLIACSMILPSRITDWTFITLSECTLHPFRPPKKCLGAYITVPMTPGSLYFTLFCCDFILPFCVFILTFLIPFCQTAQSLCIVFDFCDCEALAISRFRYVGSSSYDTRWLWRHLCQQDTAHCSRCRTAE